MDRKQFEICIVLNNSEELLKLQYKFWVGNPAVRFLIGNITPLKCELPENTTFVKLKDERDVWTGKGFDGYLHGSGIDQLIEQSTAEYLIIQDADVFWLRPDILDFFLALNVDCFGIGDVYNNIMGKFNNSVKFPNHGIQKFPNNGMRKDVPFCSGMIVKREKVLGETFALTYQECIEIKREVGWRIRDRMKENKTTCYVLKTFCYPTGSPQSLPLLSTGPPLLGSPPVYGSPHNPWIIHFTQYYFKKYRTLQPLLNCLRNCSAYWESILPPVKNIFVFGSCRVQHLEKFEHPDVTFTNNLSLTYTIQEKLQCLHLFNNPDLADVMEPQELIFCSKLPKRSDNIRELLPTFEKSHMILLEISTLRCFHYKKQYLNPAAIHALSASLTSFIDDMTLFIPELISIDECYDRILQFHSQVGYKPTLFLFPATPTNRLSKETSVVEGKIEKRLCNYPFPLYFFDINQVIGLPEDFLRLDKNQQVGAEDYELFGGSARIDYNHYSDLGKQKSHQGIVSAIQKILSLNP